MSEFTAPPSPPPASPNVDFSILSEAIELLKRRLKPMATMGAIFFGTLITFILLSIVMMFGTMLAVVNAANNNPLALIFGIYLNPFFWILMLVSCFLPVFAQAAFSAMTFQELRGEEPTFAVGFQAIKKNLGSLALLGLLVLATQFLWILALFVQAALFIAVPAIVDQKMKPIDAAKFSYEKIKECYWTVFGLYFLTSMISGLGAMACYVGIIFTIPLVGIMPTLIYWKLMGRTTALSPGTSPYPRDGSSPVMAPPAPATESMRPADLDTDESSWSALEAKAEANMSAPLESPRADDSENSEKQ